MTIKISSESSKTGKALIKPITKNLLDLILEYKLLNYPSNFYLFGKLLNSGAVKASVNYATFQHTKILKKLDLHRKNETVLYSWKHTGNINAYLAGLDIKVIQKINGHSSLQTTEVYLRKLGLFLDKTAFSIEF
jgi:integrase